MIKPAIMSIEKWQRVDVIMKKVYVKTNKLKYDHMNHPAALNSRYIIKQKPMWPDHQKSGVSPYAT